MSDTRPAPPVDLGIYSRPAGGEGPDTTDKIAIGITAGWVALCVLFVSIFGVGEGNALGPLRFLIVMLAILLPVALVWIATIAIKSARIVREESERLQASMDAMRQIYITQAQMAATTMGPNVERKIDEIVKGQKRAETAWAEFTSTRPISMPAPAPERPAPVSQPAPAAEEQPGLDFAESEPTRDPVSTADFILALNFPETVDDAKGFAALRRALSDPRSAGLVQASQDVLTLLSQDGIYMDDLSPDRARPEIWRRFASGERGPAISGLGGIRDRSSLALTSSRMRQDQIFRDACHHLLRSFDKTFSGMADQLSDEELIRLTDTRTARAFMLLGRVAGIFD